MEFDGARTYAVALQNVEECVLRVGQKKSVGVSKWVDPGKQHKLGKRLIRNGMKPWRFGNMVESNLSCLGRNQDHKMNELKEKKRYTWREKEK